MRRFTELLAAAEAADQQATADLFAIVYDPATVAFRPGGDMQEQEPPGQLGHESHSAQTIRLDELMDRWEECHARGEFLSPEELCRDCPNLLDAMRQEIALLAPLPLPQQPDVTPPTTLGAFSALISQATTSANAGQLPGYEILGELGRGGMGVVYKARQLALNRLVALKMILAGPRAEDEARSRFRREAEAVARMQHPHIVQIFEVGDCDSGAYFSMEYLEGGSLADRMHGSPLPIEVSARLAQTIALAVSHAHQRGILHRDLKPSNVLFDSDGQPRITDFGLAKLLDGDRTQTESGAIMGTPSYMAPEQAAGKLRQVGPWSDIYALGAILYEMLTGRPPFVGESPMEVLLQVQTQDPVPPSRLRSRMPRDLETICLKCLQLEPQRRYASAAVLADDLDRFLTNRPIVARPLGWGGRGLRWARRRPAPAALLAVSLAALIVLVVGGIFFDHQSREHRAAVRDHEEKAKREKADTDAQRALAELRQNALVTSQLLHVGAVVERDPDKARDLLEDDELCPKDRRDFVWGFFRHACERERLRLTEPGPVNAVAFSPDGRTLAWATGSTGPVVKSYAVTVGVSWLPGATAGEIKLLDTITGKQRPELTGHTGPVLCLAFSPSGRWIASGSSDGTVNLWDAASGKLSHTLHPKEGEVYCLAFDPKGGQLAVAGEKGNIHLYHSGTGKFIRTLSGHSSKIFALVFTRTDQLVSGGKSPPASHGPGELKFWDVNAAKVTKEVKPDSWVLSLAVSPDQQTLAVGLREHKVVFWDVPSREQRLECRTDAGWTTSLAFSPDGKTIFTAGSAGKVIRSEGKGRPIKGWEVATGRELTVLRGHANTVEAVAVSPDGLTLASAGSDGSVRLWATTMSRVLRAPGHLKGSRLPPAVLSLAFMPDGKTIISGGGTLNRKNKETTGELQTWDVASAEARTALSGHGALVRDVALAADGKTLVSGSDDGTVRLWELGQDRPAAKLVLKGHTSAVRAVAISATGEVIATAGSGELFLWDGRSEKPIRSLKGHKGQIRAVCFAPDGKTLASAGADKTVRIWDASTGESLAVLTGHGKAVTCLTFARQGSLLISGSEDATARIWDVAESKTLAILKGHEREVQSLAITPDGMTLAVGTWQEVKLWELALYQERATLRGHRGYVAALAFSPKGDRLASGAGGFHDNGSALPGELLLWETNAIVPAK